MTGDPATVGPATRHTDAAEEAAPVPARILYATCAVGFASNSLTLMLKVLVPLWAIQLGLSASEIGLTIAAAGILPVLLAIHGGSLMDRLGTRRVSLVFAVASMVLSGLYPVLPFVAALFVIQFFSGMTTQMGWLGAQTMIVQFGRGNTALIAKFSLAVRVGTFMAPIMIGAVWDLTGAWGAFEFCAAWALIAVVALLMVPKAAVEANAERAAEPVRLADLVPRRADYMQAIAMIAIPAVAFIVAVTFVRLASSAMQGAFYVVYLEGIGYSGTLIGFLIAMAEGGGLIGISQATKMERIMAPHWVLLLHVALSLFFITITPLLGGLYILLLIASGLRGSSQGLTQPVMFAILSRAVSPRDQGRSIGLRTTVNRLSAMTVPAAMGFLVEATSIEASFLILGGILIALCGVIGLVVRRIPGFAT